MERTKRVQNKQQQHLPLKEYNLKIDVDTVLKNIVNKDNQYTIPIFIPHFGCKNECVFCNQRRITGIDTTVSKDDVDKIIQEHLSYFNKRYNKKIEIAFFGGSFTGIPVNKQIEFLEVAYKYVKSGKVDSIRISTRPDYISVPILNMLKKNGVKTIELGVQSMDDEVLNASKRGHLKKDVIRAAKLISMFDINLGIQIMVGLPKSTKEKEIYTIKEVLKLNPQNLRIYPVYVLQDSKLYNMYEDKKYTPLTIDVASDRVFEILKECRKTDVKIIRVGLQSTEEITSANGDIIGPVCDNFAEYPMSKLVLDKIEKYIDNENINKNGFNVLNVYVPNKYASIVVGPNKINKKYLKEKYNVTLKIKGECK